MQCSGHSLVAPVAQFFQSPKAQRVSVARLGAIQFFVVKDDFLEDEIEKPHLLFVQFLDNPRPNPDSFLKYRFLPS